MCDEASKKRMSRYDNKSFPYGDADILINFFIFLKVIPTFMNINIETLSSNICDSSWWRITLWVTSSFALQLEIVEGLRNFNISLMTSFHIRNFVCTETHDSSYCRCALSCYTWHSLSTSLMWLSHHITWHGLRTWSSISFTKWSCERNDVPHKLNCCDWDSFNGTS